MLSHNGDINVWSCVKSAIAPWHNIALLSCYLPVPCRGRGRVFRSQSSAHRVAWSKGHTWVEGDRETSTRFIAGASGLVLLSVNCLLSEWESYINWLTDRKWLLHMICKIVFCDISVSYLSSPLHLFDLQMNYCHYGWTLKLLRGYLLLVLPVQTNIYHKTVTSDTWQGVPISSVLQDKLLTELHGWLDTVIYVTPECSIMREWSNNAALCIMHNGMANNLCGHLLQLIWIPQSYSLNFMFRCKWFWSVIRILILKWRDCIMSALARYWAKKNESHFTPDCVWCRIMMPDREQLIKILPHFPVPPTPPPTLSANVAFVS